MKVVAVLLFLSGLLLAVRVMFFGVQRRVDKDHLSNRAWPLALAAVLVALGAQLYARAGTQRGVTTSWASVVVLVGAGAGAGAWWLVRRSAAVPSADPEDDPRYRFQGHVARVIERIGSAHEPDHASTGRIAFDFDGKRHELRARWSPDSAVKEKLAVPPNSEVVIDHVEDEVAYVEPWAVVEERL